MLCESDRRTTCPVSSGLKATAVAHPNIALVKYWGKRDERLMLPHQSSLSVTLGQLQVSTTVEFGVEQEEVTLHGKPAQGKERARVAEMLQRLRETVKTPLGAAHVSSVGNFPAAAGLASSAAGFAALAVAARAAAGLLLDVREASMLARLGSGSASRSIQGGFCVWRRGQASDGSDSYASQLFPGAHWPELRLLVTILSAEKKEITSREGMKRTVETSPYYPAWVQDAEAEVDRAAERIRNRDLVGLGRIAERNAWRMHAAALGADPAICYLRPETLQLLSLLERERRGGMPVWFTLDAGPNPVLLTDAAHLPAVQARVAQAGAAQTIACDVGPDARLTEAHLF